MVIGRVPLGRRREGEIHWVVAPEPGLWTGHAGQLALFQDGAWLFIDSAGPGGALVSFSDEERMEDF
ncbi:MAG: DUF2793 domain-containing protein [Rhizobium sp.]|nr:DUF2793 domain-containing protein [Rhizobium sp.]